MIARCLHRTLAAALILAASLTIPAALFGSQL